MAEPKMAIDAVLLWMSAGNYNTPTWSEIDLARDVQVQPAWDQAEAFSRATSVKEYAKGMLELGFTASVKCAGSDTGYAALMDAFTSKTGTIELLVLDASASTNGAEGVRFTASVFGASQQQSIGEVLYREFDIKPSAYAANKPKWAEVVNSSPVFTAID